MSRAAAGRAPAVVALVLLTARVAAADDPARATQLFSEGRDAMATHDYLLACRKFTESEAADPHVGTLINLAQCEEAQGRLAEAHRYWQQALDLSRGLDDARVTYVEGELARVEARVPLLTIRLAPTAPPDTVVRRDGVDFASASFGLWLPVETGAHTLVVLASGHAPRGYEFTSVEAERREMVVEPGVLAPEPSHAVPPARPLAPPAGAGEDRSVGPASNASNEGPGAWRAVAYGAGIAGFAALALGTTYGALAVQAGAGTSGHCNGNLCDTAGTSSRNDEIAKAEVATIGLSAGAGLVVGGAVLRVLSPSPGERPYVRRNLGYLLDAAGVAAALVGSAFGVRAAVDHRDEGTATAFSAVGLGAGAALLAAGATLALTSRPHEPRSSSLRVSPSVTAGRLGLEGWW